VHLPSDFYEPEDFFLAPLEVETSGNGNGNGNGGSR
jgi:hypothetical protein